MALLGIGQEITQLINNIITERTFEVTIGREILEVPTIPNIHNRHTEKQHKYRNNIV